MANLQEWIHKLEEGPWLRFLKVTVGILVLLLLVIAYNWRAYRNMDTQGAMDSAQVARNLAEGHGFTTLFIRPFSIYLVKQQNQEKFGVVPPASRADYAEIKGMHPDLANPPVYPCLLAGWMKVYPSVLKAAQAVRDIMPGPIKRRLPDFNESLDNRLWQNNNHFWWHPDDFFIAILNEGLLFVIAWLTFLIARRLFDMAVAWTSAIFVLGCDLLWRFSSSGLSTILIILIFMVVVWCLVALEQELREPKRGRRALVLMTVALGLLVGLGGMTRYAFGWMILPVLVFLILYAGQHRLMLCLTMLAVFFATMAPWVIRNYSVSGTPFGTAGYAIIEGTRVFPEHKLERSLNPDFAGKNYATMSMRKLVSNAREIFQDELPRLGGGWVMAFFLVGLMVSFRSPAINRLRYFLLLCIATLLVVQALGRTALSDDSPEINSENLLVLLIPLVLLYGVSLFYMLLDRVELPTPKLRIVIIVVFGLILCQPLLSSFLPPRTPPVNYPPYAPPAIVQYCDWMHEDELMMSDVPWAVAWYGRRQCLPLTLDAQESFFAINDYIKPIRALYLTQRTLDSKFYSDWISAGERSWGSFTLQSLVEKRIPGSFPLRWSPRGEVLPGQMFLADWERWKKAPDADSSAP